MKGIASFVVLLLVGLGVTGYLVTRPEDRDLDAAEQAWVRDFRAWRDTTARRVDAATVGIGFAHEARNARLLAPLRRCSDSLLRLGPAPSLLTPAYEAAAEACGRAEHAVSLDMRYGVDSLASTKLHLGEAGDRLALALRDLRTTVGAEARP
jgi:hypothetical protein